MKPKHFKTHQEQKKMTGLSGVNTCVCPLLSQKNFTASVLFNILLIDILCHFLDELPGRSLLCKVFDIITLSKTTQPPWTISSWYHLCEYLWNIGWSCLSSIKESVVISVGHQLPTSSFLFA